MARSYTGWFVIALLLLAGCGSDAPETGTSSFSCHPDTLQSGSTLALTLPASVEGDLAVTDPNGTVFFAYRSGRAHPQLAPSPDQPALSSGATLRFPVDSLQLKPYAYDARAAIAVFRQRGNYTVRLGPGLADGAEPVHACTVYFAAAPSTPSPRP